MCAKTNRTRRQVPPAHLRGHAFSFGGDASGWSHRAAGSQFQQEPSKLYRKGAPSGNQNTRPSAILDQEAAKIWTVRPRLKSNRPHQTAPDKWREIQQACSKPNTVCTFLEKLTLKILRETEVLCRLTKQTTDLHRPSTHSIL